MGRIKLNYKMQSIMLIIVGIAIGIISNKIDNNYPNTQYVRLICYAIDVISIAFVFLGVKELFKKSD